MDVTLKVSLTSENQLVHEIGGHPDFKNIQQHNSHVIKIPVHKIICIL